MTAITMQKTTAGRNLFRDSTKGAIAPVISYFALGTGTTAPAAGDTTLQHEVFRKAITSYSNNGDGSIIINVYVSPIDAVSFDLEEIAIYGGKSASTKANSGTMIARGLFPHGTKLATESLQLQLTLTF